MDSREVLNTVRILLDDGRDWYFGTQQVVNIINDAQIKIIEKYVMANNEFALRPLYYLSLVADSRVLNALNDRYIKAIVGTNINPLLNKTYKPLYIRDVIVYPNYNNKVLVNEQMGFHANFLPPEEYFNFESTLGPYFSSGGVFTTEVYPHNLYYTITSEAVLGLLSEQQDKLIQFTYGDAIVDSRALVAFIAKPQTFSATQTLEIEPTYHFEVCSLAAEMINISDVGEKERGQAAIPEFGQKLNIEQIGNIVNIPSQNK